MRWRRGAVFSVEGQVRSKVNFLLIALGKEERVGQQVGAQRVTVSVLAATQCPHSSAGSRNKASWGSRPRRRTSVGGGGRAEGGDKQ